jgi:hypothetical protein
VKEIAKLEKAKRWSAHKLFRERIEREVRHGGGMALIVDLTVPGCRAESSPLSRLTSKTNVRPLADAGK